MVAPIKARSDEPRYGGKACPECGKPLPFETLLKRHPACKKKHDAQRSSARKR